MQAGVLNSRTTFQKPTTAMQPDAPVNRRCKWIL